MIISGFRQGSSLRSVTHVSGLDQLSSSLRRAPLDGRTHGGNS
jgi:hypothetical protein